MSKNKEIELVIGTRNKKGIIKKTKWYPNSMIISREAYNEYIDLRNKKEEKKRE